MKLFDSHCHLDDRSYKRDLERTLDRAHSAGVARMMSIGIDKRTSAIAVSLAQSHSGIYASVGVHPHDVKNCDESILQELVSLAQNKEPHVLPQGRSGKMVWQAT
jgi:TatD DNase family protein